ncbi:MAG: hypothetical protein J6E41_04110 [Lachnospiraceae bacterium]|nr:hypothetical protein [Lachnospiraceae bacterium]
MKTIGSMTVRYKSLPHQIRRVLSVGTLKNRSFTAFGVSRSEIGIAGRKVTVTLWSGCDEITTVHTLSRM